MEDQPPRIGARPQQIGFVVSHFRVVRKRAFQKDAQLRNVPFAGSEFGQRTAVRLVGMQAKAGEEGRRGAHHA
jgi:hypothetical protein